MSQFHDGLARGLRVYLRVAGPEPVVASVAGVATQIGVLKVSSAGQLVQARFEFDPAFAFLHDWYDVRWVTMLVGYTVNGSPVDDDGDGNPDHPNYGELPALVPGPPGSGGDDKPYFWTDAEFATGHTEGVESPWNLNPTTTTPGTKVLTFRTFPVVASVSDPGLGAKQFCVLASGFEFQSNVAAGALSAHEWTATLGAPDAALVNQALANAAAPGFPGWTAVAGYDLNACPPPPVSYDDCATPEPLAGPGTYVFENTQATTGIEGQGEALCYAFGSTAIDHDVWYAWTADATGTAQVRTCGGGSVDTKLAAYPGGACPTNGSALACNDDTCGLQSFLAFPATQGASYLLQIGTFPGAAGGPGVVQIEIGRVPGAADDCATPTAIAGQGVFAFDTSWATTGAVGQTEALCYVFGTSAVHDDVWFAWTADATGSASVQTCLSSHDTKLVAYAGGTCPTSGSALACDDDTCGLQSRVEFDVAAGTTYLLQVGSFPGVAGAAGYLEVAVAPPPPGTPLCLGDGSGGACPCGNAGASGEGCANGTGGGARLDGAGQASLAQDSLVLGAVGLPAGQPGLFFQGDVALNGGQGVAFGDGLRCAGGSVTRLGVVFADVGGGASTSALPTPLSSAGAVSAGDTRVYQLWYRDPQGSPCGWFFNLSNGLVVSWAP